MAWAQWYRQRWEIEGLCEIKPSLQVNAFVLRRRQPARVHQDIWGVYFVAYTLIRCCVGKCASA